MNPLNSYRKSFVFCGFVSSWRGSSIVESKMTSLWCKLNGRIIPFTGDGRDYFELECFGNTPSLECMQGTALNKSARVSLVVLSDAGYEYEVVTFSMVLTEDVHWRSSANRWSFLCLARWRTVCRIFLIFLTECRRLSARIFCRQLYIVLKSNK